MLLVLLVLLGVATIAIVAGGAIAAAGAEGNICARSLSKSSELYRLRGPFFGLRRRLQVDEVIAAIVARRRYI